MSNYVFAPPPPTDAENNVYATWENGFSKEELDSISAYCDQAEKAPAGLPQSGVNRALAGFLTTARQLGSTIKWLS